MFGSLFLQPLGASFFELALQKRHVGLPFAESALRLVSTALESLNVLRKDVRARDVHFALPNGYALLHGVALGPHDQQPLAGFALALLPRRIVQQRLQRISFAQRSIPLRLCSAERLFCFDRLLCNLL